MHDRHRPTAPWAGDFATVEIKISVRDMLRDKVVMDIIPMPTRGWAMPLCLWVNPDLRNATHFAIRDTAFCSVRPVSTKLQQSVYVRYTVALLDVLEGRVAALFFVQGKPQNVVVIA